MPYAPSEKSRTDADGNIIPWFSVTGKDRPITPELCAALAGVVIEWGAFEGAIYADTAELMQYPSIRKLTDKAPRSFKKKIELWKKAIHAFYPAIPSYLEAADEICSKGKTIAHHRHHLIHGHWLPPPADADGSVYKVMMIEGLDTVENLKYGIVDAEYVAAVRNDIKTVSDTLWGFKINRTMHARLGLLKATRVPAP